MTKTAEARASVHIGAEKASWPAVSGTPAADFVAKATAEEEITLHRSRALPGVELWAIRGSTRPWTVLQSTYTFGVAERLSGEIVWRAGQRTSSLSLASIGTGRAG